TSEKTKNLFSFFELTHGLALKFYFEKVISGLTQKKRYESNSDRKDVIFHEMVVLDLIHITNKCY
ncbi:TPA: hypothetical protein ACGVZT_002951, partial [Enterococcus faecium]